MTRGYHFVGKAMLDGRPIPPDGEWLTHDGPVKICETGLHASKCPRDALEYAPGDTLCLVECEDIVVEQDDKFVCRRRKIIARFDATDMLWEMSRWCALQVIHLWDAPPVVREYLETGNESLRAAAWDAAWDAARAAARAAAWDAAMDAARAAAMDAARAAARAAAWDAARDAAWDAARDAAWDAQKAKFAEMVNARFAEIA